MKRSGTLIAIALLFSAIEVFPGCASQQTKTTHSTTTTSTPSKPQASTTTRTETTEQQQKPDSLFRATARAVATVILLPFRLIGDAVELIV